MFTEFPQQQAAYLLPVLTSAQADSTCACPMIPLGGENPARVTASGFPCLSQPLAQPGRANEERIPGLRVGPGLVHQTTGSPRTILRMSPAQPRNLNRPNKHQANQAGSMALQTDGSHLLWAPGSDWHASLPGTGSCIFIVFVMKKLGFCFCLLIC